MYEPAALELYRLFRLVQERNRAVGPLHGTDLELLESHFLSELDARPNSSIKELIDVMSLQQSSVSRLINRLVKRGYLSSQSSVKDKRQKVIKLTPKARRNIEQIDRAADKLLVAYLKTLRKAEQQKLLEYFRRLADAFGQLPGVRRLSEHCFRPEQRRIARCLSMLSRNYLNSDISVAQWHILSVLGENNNILTAADLSQRLVLAGPNVSSALKDLRKKGLLVQNSVVSDKRKFALSLTVKGQEFLAQLELLGATHMQQALTNFSATERDNFVKLLAKFTGRTDKNIIIDKMNLRILQAHEYALARSFFIVQSVAEGHEEHVPELLFTDKQKATGLFQANKLVAIWLIADESPRRITAFAALKEVYKTDLVKRATSSIKQLVENGQHKAVWRIDYEPLRRLLLLT